MPNVTITQLPAAAPLTGSELVPVVQNGVTVRTTAAAVASAPNQFQTFLTLVQEPTLPNSRYLSTGTGLGLTDGGAQSFYRLTLNGTSGSLEALGLGLVAKTAGNTVSARAIGASGGGIAVTNGDGVAGNPTIALSGLPAALASLGGTGMLAVVGGSVLSGRQIVGTASQIAVAAGDGSGNPTISLESNPVLPGSGSVTIPIGTTAQRPAGSDGQFRFNTSLGVFEGYYSGSWQSFGAGGGGGVSTFSGGSTGLTPASPTAGAITLGGTLAVANGGTGQTTYTDGQLLIGNSTGNTLTKATLTAGTNVTITNGPGTITISATGGGGGGVTSVGATWTGGIVSISGSPITTNGTFGFTVAGTSGGIPYFSSASAWASSAVLAANALMVGGGAGAAPATVTTGTGVITALGVNTGTAGAFVVNGGALGTPSGGTLTNCSGLSLTAGVTGTLPVANGGTGVTTSTGSGNTVLSTAPTLTTPVLSGTASGTTAGRLGYLSGALSYGTGSVQRTVVNLDESQTLTNKTINGSNNTITNVSLATGVTGTLAVANGGTGATDAATARSNLTAQKTITSGTAAPSGGSDGDIYLQYV